MLKLKACTKVFVVSITRDNTYKTGYCVVLCVVCGQDMCIGEALGAVGGKRVKAEPATHKERVKNRRQKMKKRANLFTPLLLTKTFIFLTSTTTTTDTNQLQTQSSKALFRCYQVAPNEGVAFNQIICIVIKLYCFVHSHSPRIFVPELRGSIYKRWTFISSNFGFTLMQQR